LGCADFPSLLTIPGDFLSVRFARFGVRSKLTAVANSPGSFPRMPGRAGMRRATVGGPQEIRGKTGTARCAPKMMDR
jgi:hypothetical protein